MTRNKKFKYPEKAIDAGKKKPPALCVTPGKSIPPRISVVRSSCGGKNTFIHLIPAGCCLLPPPKKNPGVPVPPSTQISSQKQHPLAFHPSPPASRPSLTCRGWMSSMPAGLFVLGSRGRRSVAFVCWRVWVCNAAPRSRSMNSPSSWGGETMGR